MQNSIKNRIAIIRRLFPVQCALSIGIVSTASAAITPHIVLNRTTGVAPLAVFADATTTEGLTDNDNINAYFGWNFDRDGVEATGKHSLTRGFVAAHVYEKPGTYTIALTVVDRAGATASATAQITVSAFNGTTYYVASDGSNSAAGTSMSAPLATLDYALKQKAAPNTMILFSKGDRFTANGFTISGINGPVIVGPYVDPNKPSDQAPVLYSTAADGWGFIGLGSGTSDWRLMDLHVRGPHDRAFNINGATNILLLRIEADSVGRDFSTAGGANLFVFDCLMHDFGMLGGAGYGLFGDPFNQSAFVGNVSRRQQGGEHLFRTQSGSKMFIAYNDLDSVVNVMSAIQIRGSSSLAYLLGNRVVKDCGVHPQNSTSNEHESFCVVDGNTFINAGLAITAKHIGVRNNLFFNGNPSLDIHPIVGMSDSVTLLNNTCYGAVDNLVSGSATNVDIKSNILFSTTTDNWAAGLSSSGFTGCQIDNNLYYAPRRSGGALSFNGNGFSDWQTSGYDLHGKYGFDPLFVSTDRSSPDFLKLSAGSPAVKAGAKAGEAAPVFSDFNGASRAVGQATDMGARLFSATGVRTRIGDEKNEGFSLCRKEAATYDIRGRKSVYVAPPGSVRRAAGVLILRQSANRYILFGIVPKR